MISLNDSFSRIQPLYEYLKKREENARFFKSLEITATFLLVSFFLIFAIRPTVITISSLLGEIKAKQELSAQMKIKINSVVQAQDSYSAVQEKYDIIQDAFPSQPKYANFYSQLAGVGRNLNIDMHKLSFTLDNPSRNDLPAGIGTFSVTITSKNDFGTNVEYIDQLSSLRRIMAIDNFGLNVIQDANSASASPSAQHVGRNIGINFSVNSYYWK